LSLDSMFQLLYKCQVIIIIIIKLLCYNSVVCLSSLPAGTCIWTRRPARLSSRSTEGTTSTLLSSRLMDIVSLPRSVCWSTPLTSQRHWRLSLEGSRTTRTLWEQKKSTLRYSSLPPLSVYSYEWTNELMCEWMNGKMN